MLLNRAVTVRDFFFSSDSQPEFMIGLYPFGVFLHSGSQIAISPHTKYFAVDWLGVEVSRATLGIIGMGRIGYKVAQRARAFDMKILYHNRKQR